MQKWACFSMGVMAGLILVLTILLVSQQHENVAYASPPPPMPQDVGGGAGTIMVAGGTQQNLLDMVWVLYRRRGKAPSTGDEDEGSLQVTGEYRISLAAYRVSPGGRGKLKLIGVRDLSYDVEAVEYMNDPPTVAEFKRELERMAEKEKEKKKKTR